MKLPVLATVREAFVFLWQRRSTFWSLVIPGIVFLSILGVLSIWLTWFVSGSPESFSEFVGTRQHRLDPNNFGFVIVAVLVDAVAYCAFVILYSVAWHRAYLLPDESVTIGSAYRWRMRQTRFLFNYVKIFLAILAIMLFFWVAVAGIGPMVMAFGIPQLLILFQIAYLIVAGLVFARSSLLFPATAVDQHVDLAKGWAMSNGNSWRLFFIILFVGLPIWLISVPANVLITFAWFGTSIGASLTGNLILTLIYHFLAFIGIAVGVTALSISYQRLTLAAAMPEPDA